MGHIERGEKDVILHTLLTLSGRLGVVVGELVACTSQGLGMML